MMRAMEKCNGEEIAIMYNRQVWRLTKLPEGPLGCRWLYTVKRDETGKIARYKARLVTQGYKQIKREMYNETFSPIINFSIRFFFTTLVSGHGWTHLQCHVKRAHYQKRFTRIHPQVLYRREKNI